MSLGLFGQITLTVMNIADPDDSRPDWVIEMDGPPNLMSVLHEDKDVSTLLDKPDGYQHHAEAVAKELATLLRSKGNEVKILVHQE